MSTLTELPSPAGTNYRTKRHRSRPGDALEFARRHLIGSIRSIPRESALNHALRVNSITRSVFCADNHTATVALLHDILEDSRATVRELERAAGKRVASDVLLLTKPLLGPKVARRRMYLNGLLHGPDSVKLVKLADYLDNLGARRGTPRLETTAASAKRFIDALRSQPVSDSVRSAIEKVEQAMTKLELPAS